mgnify:CR=1 FL=1
MKYKKNQPLLTYELIVKMDGESRGLRVGVFDGDDTKINEKIDLYIYTYFTTKEFSKLKVGDDIGNDETFPEIVEDIDFESQRVYINPESIP